MAGRRKVITCEEYLNAVKKIHSMDDLKISKVLKVGKSTVWRFRTEKDKDGNLINEECVNEAKEYMGAIENINVEDINNWDIFKILPIISEWEKILRNRRMVGDERNSGLRRSFWHVCKHLKIHPAKINPEDCEDLVSIMKRKHYAGEKQPRGLAYSRIRESIRSFFTLIKHISGEHLGDLGIDKPATKGQGKYARLKVSKEVRDEFQNVLFEMCDTREQYLDTLFPAYFMYNTGTRINATLNFSFKTNEYSLTKDKWTFKVIDKGEKGGKEWDKVLIDYALEEFKKFCSERFNIPYDDLERDLPRKIDYLFPTYVDRIKKKTRNSKLSQIYKTALIKAGLSYQDFPPSHIWRHSFAQDFLKATNYNYELCASLGGWVNTGILKKHYGKMDEEARINGLRKAMGLPVEEQEITELRW